jgi:mono/diheme cytochrome c family protein
VSGPDLGAVVPGLSATDVEAIVSGGSGNMPPISSLSTDQVVTVSAYVVETWGN